MSLQNEDSIVKYANASVNIWKNWLKTTKAERVQKIREAITGCVGFLPAFTISTYNENDMGDFGYHRPSDFSVNINEHQAGASVILFDNWIEWVTTPYHESRHAEQTFRIAQGVASGALELPRKGFAQQMQAMHLRSPQQIRQAFETKQPMGLDQGSKRTALHQWLRIPMAVINQADAQSGQFAVFCNSGTRPWFEKRSDPVKNAVIDWMKMDQNRYMREIDRKAQANAGKSRGYGRMYESLPEEKDAFGVEKYLQGKICTQLAKTRPADGFHMPPGLAALWTTKTARFGHTRSSDLKNVDAALTAYETSQTRVNLAKLKTNFNHWYTRNPNERNARNVDNIIESLKSYIAEADNYGN